MPDNANERRSHNRRLAETCAKAGLYVFPSLNKVPITLAWERVDTAIGTDAAEEIRAAARAKAAAKNREFDEDMPIGCTNDVDTVKRIWRRYPDAVPSISLGPSKLLVLDCDIYDNLNGPEAMTSWLENTGISLSNCPMTRSQSGGLHIFFQGENLRSHVGRLMKSLGCQVKAAGNQVVAPGAWREDGKRYVSVADRPGLLSAYAAFDLPAVPAPILALQTERELAEPKIEDKSLADLVEELKAAALPDTGSLDMLFDFDGLAAKDAEFREIRDNPTSDASHNRFTFLKCLQREYRDQLKPADCFALVQEADGMGDFVGDAAQKQGEWNYRNFVRDYVRSKTSWSVSDGKVLGKVDDVEEPDDYLPDHYVQAKADMAEKKKAAVWKVENLSDLEEGFEPILWLVDGLIELGTLGVPYGPPGAGKSAWTIDLCLRITHGLPWQDRDTLKLGVLYISQEGMKGSKRRVQAWQKHARANDLVLDPQAPFFMVRRQIDLFTGDTDYKAIRKAIRDIAATGIKIGVIVIDTLRAAMVGGDENKQSDTSIIMAALNRLCIATGATILAIHHTGKDVDKGASGSTNIIGSADWSLEITKGRVRTRKVRDADDGQVFGFKTIGVSVGTDSRGREQTAVVVEACAVREEARKKPASGKAVEAAFGDVSGEDSAEGDETPTAPVSDRSRTFAAGLAEVIARSAIDDGLVAPDADGFKTVVDLAEHCEALAEMIGPNLARKLSLKVFGQEPFVKTPVGKLWYEPAKGRRGARLKVERS